MKTIVPDYYDKFKCIAGNCQHTCCEGWEIDVDEDTLQYYQEVPGEMGQLLKDNIVLDDCPHFRLSDNERCPFLNDENLCRIILTLGEDALCQICSDHPRFRNDFYDRTELGLGLCCEAAASLILNEKEKVRLVIRSDDGSEEITDEFETLITRARDHAISIAQNREIPFGERIARLKKDFHFEMPDYTDSQWAAFFRTLEQLDPEWSRQLELLGSGSEIPRKELPECFELPLEQLLVYFLYRHLPSASDETDLPAYVGFAILGCEIIRKLSEIREAETGLTMADLQEFARLYSSEIEYSEENTEAIVDLIWNYNQ